MRHGLAVLVAAISTFGEAGGTASTAGGQPVWLAAARIVVCGVGLQTDSCRTGVCPHNENTDLIRRGAAIFLVHRTAMSQVLGPNSSLRVLRSDDAGASFQLQAVIPAPLDRDIRDPHFFTIGDRLAIKALTRLPVTSVRDSDVDTVTVLTTSADGATWSPPEPIAPPTWSLWRVRSFGGAYYAAAYEDGDRSVRLFRSADGRSWTAGATIYPVAADTPLETELVFVPSGKLLALVRMDGTDDELLGNVGRLRTKVCWASPPYAAWDCSRELDGVRLDGPVAFFHGKRLFVVARKHFIEVADRKRTALYELTGDFNGGDLAIVEHGELPSAGDTSYAGVAPIDGNRVLVTWYSSSRKFDDPWSTAIFAASDIWQATIDLSRL